MALRFEQLIGALAGAVVDAQHQVRQAHLGELWSYFKEGSPISVELQIPRVNMKTGLPEPVKVSVPLAILVNPSQLTIQQMQLTMNVDLSEILEAALPEALPKVPPGQHNVQGYEWKPPGYSATIAASTTSGKQPGQVGVAQVTLTVVAEGPPEGLARLLTHLTKCL